LSNALDFIRETHLLPENAHWAKAFLDRRSASSHLKMPFKLAASAIILSAQTPYCDPELAQNKQIYVKLII